MTISDKALNELLSVHNGLWDMKSEVSFYGRSYTTHTASHKGYTSVVLPSKTGSKLLYITQNLNKSTYGTLEIQRAAKEGKTVKLTWIVDTSDGQYEYKGLIKTTPDLTYIESYSSFGTAIAYSTDPNYIPIKSRY
jgi:hypothetical protein